MRRSKKDKAFSQAPEGFALADTSPFQHSDVSIAFVEITNQRGLYVFETYYALELETGFDNEGWNSFATH